MRGRCYPTDLTLSLREAARIIAACTCSFRSLPIARKPAGTCCATWRCRTSIDLLTVLTPTGRDEGDASSFSPPHERALAAAWRLARRRRPAAVRRTRRRRATASPPARPAWALLTPAHWQLGRDDVVLLDPAALGLAEAESRALFASAGELLASEGFAVAWGARRPLVRGARRPRGARDGIARSRHRPQRRPLAARERERRRRREPARAAALMRRLQSEAQLVFHSHAGQRSARGARRARGELVLAERLRPRARPADPAATPELLGALARAPARRRLGGLGRGLARARRRAAGAPARAGAARRGGDADALRRAQRRRASMRSRRARSGSACAAASVAAHDVLAAL